VLDLSAWVKDASAYSHEARPFPELTPSLQSFDAEYRMVLTLDLFLGQMIVVAHQFPLFLGTFSN
jgi:hypothetical protein